MDAIERLQATEEIKQLKSRYLFALDKNDWVELGEVFAADAVMDLTEEVKRHQGEAAGEGMDPIARGRDTIVEFISSAVGPGVSVHEGHAPLIEVTGPDEATGRWQLHDYIEYEDSTFHGFGHYHEKYRRIDGRWLISFMTISRIRLDWS
jgi:hypothetical protein